MPGGFQQIREEEEEDEQEANAGVPEGGRGRWGGGRGVSPPLVLGVLAAALSSLQIGYHIGVINAPQEVLQAQYNATWVGRWGAPPPPGTVPALWALSVGVFSAGATAAAPAVGQLAERLGRKGALLASNGLAVVGGALMGGAKLGPSYILIILGRFLVGAYSGLASGLVPMYVGEVSPPRLRGALGSVHQLGIVLGILAAQVLGLRELLGSAAAWPVLLALGLGPAALQLLLLPLCPDSPRGGGRGPRFGLLSLLVSPGLRQPLLLTLGLHLAQQLSGINAIFYYSTSIFAGAGLSRPAAATIGTGTVNVAATALSMVLVERVGRRRLLLIGLLGMMGCALSLTLALNIPAGPLPRWLAVGSVLAFVGFFAVGPGPLPWFVGGELFPPGPRPAATAAAATLNWAANCGVALAFPGLQRSLGSWVFLLFGGLLAAFALFAFLRLPETQGRTFEGGTHGGGYGGDPGPPDPPGHPQEKDSTELQCLAGGGGEEEEL